MKNLSPRLRTLRLLPLIALFVFPAAAQSQPAPPSRDELFRTISALDKAVFDAYNQCDLEKFGTFFPEALEFYHDNGGLTDTSRKTLLESLKNNICGKVRRELVPGTLEVYPMNGYGALE